MMNFEVQVPGKWILAGEHAVLRGSPALVFPLVSRALRLTAKPAVSRGNDLSLQLTGEHGEELQLLFWGVLERACELKKVRRSDLKGEILIHSSLPVGAGLGASAALSVAVTRWLQSLKVVGESEGQDFARQLENLFHGESSGVDVAVALSGQALRYVRGEAPQFFKPHWAPRCYVSYSGKRGVTLECVQKVKALLKAQPEIGLMIDQDMARAEKMAEQALQMSAIDGLSLLRESFDLALGCFERWGLNQGSPEQHQRWLRDQGALAVKPTGSGNGGYVLSLWDRELAPEVAKKLIPCF